jgi:hypothetical protein
MMKIVHELLSKADSDSCLGRSLLNNADQLEQRAAEACSHPLDQIREQWESGQGPPWTICLVCGYSEEGWGIGGWKLPSGYINHMPIPKIGLDEFMQKRRFFRTQSDISHEKICVPHHKKTKDKAKCDGVCR